MALGSPTINIKLRELARVKNNNASSDVVLLILKGKSALDFVVRTDGDIPSELEENNVKLVKDALKGGMENKNINGHIVPTSLAPSKVIVKVISSSGNVKNTLEECKNIDFNVLAVPCAKQIENADIVKFIDYMNDNGTGCIGIIKDSATSTKNRNIIRYNTNAEGYDSGESGTSELSSRIAGIVAGVPLNQSVTYQVMDDIKVTDNLSKADIDKKIGEGELVIARMSGHTRIVRGVTTFLPNGEVESPFSKIKLVQGYNFIQNAVKDVLINDYLGKVQNSFDNKVLLCTAIKSDLLDNLDFIEGNSEVVIDTEAQKKYLKSQNVNVDVMSKDEIDRYRTNSKVFINIFCTVFDTMEDFDMNVNIEA